MLQVYTSIYNAPARPIDKGGAGSYNPLKKSPADNVEIYSFRGVFPHIQSG